MSEKINIHFLNAGAGDSIVIEFCLERTHYVVIDSNLVEIDSQKINPAYEFLKSKNASNISTLIITHLHQDHYNGIEFLLNDFEIKKIVIPPFVSVKSSQYNKILDKYREKIKAYIERCSDDEVFQYCKSLTYLLHFLTNNDCKVEEVSGKESILRFPGIENFYGRVYLPLKKITGVLHNFIEHYDFDLNHFPRMNDSSIAFCLNCYGHNILLTGDSTLSQWNEHKRQMEWDDIANLNIDFLKVPHHGSKYDNTEKLYKYLLKQEDNPKYVFTSADGIKHPDKELFELIEKLNLRPYCTNLSRFCLPPNVLQYKPMSEIPKQMHIFLSNYVESSLIPCQGDIQLSMSNEKIGVTCNTGMPCVYRDIN